MTFSNGERNFLSHSLIYHKSLLLQWNHVKYDRFGKRESGRVDGEFKYSLILIFVTRHSP